MELTNSLLPIRNLSMTDSVLYDFVTAQSNGVHVKDAISGAYILINATASKIYGINDANNVLGNTVFDLDKFMRPYWGFNYAEQITQMDYRVKEHGEVYVKKHDVILNHDNQVYIQDMIKLPLIGKNNKITAVLTLLTDITYKADLFYLYGLYKTMYANKSIGLKQFIAYLGLTAWLSEDLTDKEIFCLLHMITDSSYKSISRKLDIGTRTVETHVSHIMRKIKDKNLSDILSHLRQGNL